MQFVCLCFICFFFHDCPRIVEGQVSLMKWTSCQHGLCLLQHYPFSVSSGVRNSNVTMELQLWKLWPFQVTSLFSLFTWAVATLTLLKPWLHFYRMKTCYYNVSLHERVLDLAASSILYLIKQGSVHKYQSKVKVNKSDREQGKRQSQKTSRGTG